MASVKKPSKKKSANRMPLPMQILQRIQRGLVLLPGLSGFPALLFQLFLLTVQNAIDKAGDAAGFHAVHICLLIPDALFQPGQLGLHGADALIYGLKLLLQIRKPIHLLAERF